MKNGQKSINNYDCEICHYTTSILQNYNKHLLTLKHKSNTESANLATLGNIFLAKKYKCNCCDYITNKKSHYDIHIVSEKHKNNVNSENKEIKHICFDCNKEYSNYNALWKHRKKCIVTNDNNIDISINNKQEPNEKNNNIPTELFIEVIKESKELQQVLIEQNKELQNKLLEKQTEFQNKLLEKDNILIEQNNKLLELAKNQSIVNNNNTTNQQFNMNFFLNETCKDAMNIVDFINSLKLTTDDFETTGKLGFVDGISRIFIKELKKLNKEKLPIHCTDLKRETVYIKDNDIWEKENDEKKKLKWTIDRIAQLNLNQIQQWQEKYPQCKENNTKENEKFTTMALVALGGRGKEQEDKFRDKIMKNVMKEVVLDRQNKINR